MTPDSNALTSKCAICGEGHQGPDFLCHDVPSVWDGMPPVLHEKTAESLTVKQIYLTDGPPYHTGYGTSWALYGVDGEMVNCSWTEDEDGKAYAVPIPAGYYFLAAKPGPQSVAILSDIQSPDPAPEPTVDHTVYEKTVGNIIVKRVMWSDGSVTETEMEYNNLGRLVPAVRHPNGLESDGAGGFRRRPRPLALFDMTQLPRENWAWVVEKRYLQRQPLTPATLLTNGADLPPPVLEYWGDWGDWGDWGKSYRDAPYGFKTRVAALRRRIDLLRSDSTNVGLGIVEYRVSPQYLGYKPVNEAWYQEDYQSDPGPTVTGPLFTE